MDTKKILLIMLVSSLGWITLQAQADDPKEDRFSIGPRFGINFSNVSNVEESETATGIAIGLTSTYSLSENSGLTVDLLYTEEGWEQPVSSEYDLRYLQIPIYFNYFFGQLGERFRPKVYVGIAPAFFLNGELDDTEVNDGYFSKFVVSASGGLGFNYRIGSRIWLNTDLRSYLGLSDVRDGDVVGDPQKISNIQLSLGLAYGLARMD